MISIYADYSIKRRFTRFVALLAMFSFIALMLNINLYT